MRAPPKITEHKLVAQSRIFRIEAVDLEFSNGETRTYERMLGGHDSVMVIAMPDPDSVLLVREYAVGSERYELGFPKGVVEKGEDPLLAAERELQEETGYGARNLELLRRVALVPGYIQHATKLVLARDLYPKRAEGDEPEPIEVVPWSLSKLDELLARDDFNEARSIAALFLTQRYLGG